jgi:hypothetical protein
MSKIRKVFIACCTVVYFSPLRVQVVVARSVHEFNYSNYNSCDDVQCRYQGMLV